MSSIPSLSNPPSAPKKPKQGRRNPSNVRRLNLEEDEGEVSWRWLTERNVREKFLRYNPEDIEEIGDIDFLLMLKDFYSPSSQPLSIYEYAYCQLMTEALERKMYML